MESKNKNISSMSLESLKRIPAAQRILHKRGHDSYRLSGAGTVFEMIKGK